MLALAPPPRGSVCTHPPFPGDVGVDILLEVYPAKCRAFDRVQGAIDIWLKVYPAKCRALDRVLTGPPTGGEAEGHS